MSEHEPMPVLPSLAIAPSIRQTLIAIYRDLAEGSYLFRQDDIVQHCLTQIDRLSYGGEITLWSDEPCSV